MTTSFTKIHLGKSLDENITAQDIIEYFSEEREENLTLEFKSYVADKNGGFSFDGVLKTIGAFLNSEGGLLVFGAPSEVRRNEKYRVVKGAPTPVPTSLKTKDGLVNLIHDSISYMPTGIKVAPVDMDNGQFVYLIEVQESESKPHQYKLHYPVRLDGQSVGAPHYLVEALFNQIRRPELLGYMRVVSHQVIPQNETSLIQIILEASVFNSSSRDNDSDVYLHLMTSAGMFGYAAKDTGLTFSANHKTVSVFNAASIISDGMPVRKRFRLLINNSELLEIPEKMVRIIFTFGGKTSATKFSKYNIRFNFHKLPLSPGEQYEEFTREIDLNNLLTITRDENNVSYGNWDGTLEERINATLSGI